MPKKRSAADGGQFDRAIKRAVEAILFRVEVHNGVLPLDDAMLKTWIGIAVAKACRTAYRLGLRQGREARVR